MKATIEGIIFEGTPAEVFSLIREAQQLKSPARELGIGPYDGLRRQNAASTCGVPPLAPASLGGLDREEPPRRKGRHKVVAQFKDGTFARYYNLTHFYNAEGVRKCDFSPSEKMEAGDRKRTIAVRIAGHFADKGKVVSAVFLSGDRYFCAPGGFRCSK